MYSYISNENIFKAHAYAYSKISLVFLRADNIVDFKDHLDYLSSKLKLLFL
jgi:hypothetical protein